MRHKNFITYNHTTREKNYNIVTLTIEENFVTLQYLNGNNGEEH